MIDRPNTPPAQDVRDWWRSEIVDMAPGEIRFRGYPIEQLIGAVSFVQMIWLLTRGELPAKPESDLLEAALVAAVDHGPQSPSIAIARMAATCGLGINNAIASAVNVLGDVHGGAGEQAVELFQAIEARLGDGAAIDSRLGDGAVEAEIEAYQRDYGRYLPGFGHRFHPVDPRAPRLLALVDAAAAAGTVSGRIAAIARAVEARLAEGRTKPVPLNIDGASAVIYAELGFAPPLARGLFCLSRSVGILAHAWEQTNQGERNKGPVPRHHLWTYDGPPPRPVPDDA